MKVFFDTGAWLALEISTDVNHSAAKKHLQILKSKRALLFVNALVLSETYTRLIYDYSLTTAKKFHEKIIEGSQKNLTILEVDSTERDRAWQELHQYSDHALSFIDATIIVQFKEYQLDEIFTFDTDFRNINLPTNL